MVNNTLIEILKKTDAYKERTKILSEIIQPIQKPTHSIDIEAVYLSDKLNTWGERYGKLDINPDYQRGNAWEQQDQICFIENLIRDNVDRKAKTISVNIVGFKDGQVETDIESEVTILDGLQRYTAIEAMNYSELKQPSFRSAT